MRRLLAVAVAALAFGGYAVADDKKGPTVEVAGFKAVAPADWKEETPSNRMRLAQLKLPKEKGDPEDAELAVYVTPGGGGVKANLDRQEKKFKLAEGVKKEDAVKTEEIKFGSLAGTLQDISGTFLFKTAPFDPNSKVTEKEKFRQLYVITEDDDKNIVSFALVGPEKTVEKRKKEFVEFVKSFKK